MPLGWAAAVNNVTIHANANANGSCDSLDFLDFLRYNIVLFAPILSALWRRSSTPTTAVG